MNCKEIEEKILVKKVKIATDTCGVNRRRERISGTRYEYMDVVGTEGDSRRFN
jgi:hypothetical protein